MIRVPARGRAFEAALEGLTRVNVGLMCGDDGPEGVGLPSLYESGVRYKNEPRDVWRHAVDVAREGWGDCEDLSAYRAAELRVSGEDPDAAVSLYRSGPNRFHAVVRRGDGTYEDPSRVLGMGAGKMPRLSRRSANVVGADPSPGEPAITFEILRIPKQGYNDRGGYRGFIRFPLGFNIPSPTTGAPVPAAVLSLGPQASTPAAASQAAAKEGSKALANLANNPEVQKALSTIPGGKEIATLLQDPETQQALKDGAKALKSGIKDAASSIKSGIKSLKFW